MQEAKSVSDYCVRIKDVVNKMATLGETVSNEVLIKNALRYLTHRWNHVARLCMVSSKHQERGMQGLMDNFRKMASREVRVILPFTTNKKVLTF